MSRTEVRPPALSLAPSAALATGLHVGLLVLAVWITRGPTEVLPPVYRINLVAAPAGPRAIGQVQPDVPRTEPATAPVPSRVEALEKNPVRTEAPTRRPPPPRATQVPNATRAEPKGAVPTAGGGQKGGTGTDVANVETAGVEFPFPAYLRNIVNQIGANFETTDPRPWSVDIAFRIRRDGSVMDIEIRKASGNRIFDIGARGAVEAAGRSRAFGPLPDGFGDDVLPVIFTVTSQMFR
ncbi:MAG: TonB C-terminal domain-containing protein [Gemmatimonadetes bacterium]|nr:TonB C-terminal domain-containing protein [Gemmatimonadota bacterium]